MIVLDTHVLLWAVNGEGKLGPRTIARIEVARDSGVLVPAIVPWEIALLVSRDQVQLRMSVTAWCERVLSRRGIAIAPLDPGIAADAVFLPGPFHKDPADRLIVATARALRLPLVTADRAILRYAAAGHVGAVDARH